jgi:hypothetical protein
MRFVDIKSESGSTARIMCSMTLTMVVLLALTGCQNILDDKKTTIIKNSDFQSPGEFVENPSVTSAIDDSGITIIWGNSPPALAGDYNASGHITDTSYELRGLVGRQINSLFTLYNQTTSGGISFRESVGGYTAWGSGGYVTGAGGQFTIWQESKQSGPEAGLPNDITINVALIMSGSKLNTGNLNARGVSIITDVITTNTSYNTDNVRGRWWAWDVNLSLVGAGNQDNPVNSPANVNATDGTSTSYVRVTWSSVTGASHYRVYRNTSSSSSGASAISSWQTTLSFDDTTTTQGTTYYYWVKAAANSSGERESDFGGPDTGWRAASASWTVGNLAAGGYVWYGFGATAGTVYNVQWDDSYQGSGAYSADICVSAYRPGLTSYYFYRIDSGYISPRTFTATATETVYIKVEGYSQSDFGSFAIRVYTSAGGIGLY